MSRPLLPFSLPLAGAACCLSVSCVSTQVHLVEEAGAARSGTRHSIVVGGVFTEGRAPSLGPSEALTVGRDLAWRLDRSSRKRTAEAPPALEKIAGPAKLRAGHDRSNLSAFLTSRQAARLAESRFDTVFFLVIRSEETWSDVTDDESTETEHVTDEHGDMVACHTTTTFTTSSRSHRRLAIDSYAYDARSGRQIWHASSDHGEHRSRSTRSTFDYPQPPPFPEPPTRIDVIENIARSISRKLPNR